MRGLRNTAAIAIGPKDDGRDATIAHVSAPRNLALTNARLGRGARISLLLVTSEHPGRGAIRRYGWARETVTPGLPVRCQRQAPSRQPRVLADGQRVTALQATERIVGRFRVARIASARELSGRLAAGSTTAHFPRPPTRSSVSGERVSLPKAQRTVGPDTCAGLLVSTSREAAVLRRSPALV
jgi:hypothetical protein